MLHIPQQRPVASKMGDPIDLDSEDDVIVIDDDDEEIDGEILGSYCFASVLR